ncbi:Transposase DDE domain-containing protein [Rhizobacter sp. OV335]|nr:Transposase DDE domain-containing protein [Rhizobacter sp. OV335]
MQEGLFTLAKLDDFVPADHPLRAIHGVVNEALTGLNGLFNAICAETGRASIAPEKLLRAMLIQVFFSVRNERQLMEQVRYNLLFRWFIGSAALTMLDTVPGAHRKTVAADKGYDTRDFIAGCRKRGMTPHVASHTTRRGGSAVDGRTARHAGYAASHIVRKRIEEHFGWAKTVGRLRQTMYRGLQRVDQQRRVTRVLQTSSVEIDSQAFVNSARIA